MKRDIPQMVVYKQRYNRNELIGRLLWGITWNLLIRYLPHKISLGWTRFWYQIFGTKITSKSSIYPSVRVFMPWNLVIGDFSVIGNDVHIYNAEQIIIGNECVISEKSFLCTASHNIHSIRHEHIQKPIVVNNKAWIAADAFVGMGVTIGEGAVVGARAAVFKDVEPWTVVGGNPARVIKRREIDD